VHRVKINLQQLAEQALDFLEEVHLNPQVSLDKTLLNQQVEVAYLEEQPLIHL
jgi:hypothetical protein